MQTIDIYPENVAVWDAWLALETQWRMAVGAGGAAWLGLDYAAIPGVLKLLGVRKGDRSRVFAGLREMEAVALPVRNGVEA